MSSQRRDVSSIFSEALRCMLRLSGVRGTSWSSRLFLCWETAAIAGCEGRAGGGMERGADCSSEEGGGGGMDADEEL